MDTQNQHFNGELWLDTGSHKIHSIPGHIIANPGVLAKIIG